MWADACLQEVEPEKNYISGVPASHLSERIIGRIAPLLETAIQEEHDCTLESLIADLFTQDTQLWVVNDFEALLLTRIVNRPRRRILNIEWMVGKNMKDWLDDWMPIQMKFAKDNGCERVEFGTQRSVERAVKQMHPEFEPMYTIYRCKVE